MAVLIFVMGAHPAAAFTDEKFTCLHVGMSMRAAEIIMGEVAAKSCSTTLGIEKCVYVWKSWGIRRADEVTATFVLDHLVSKKRCAGRCAAPPIS